LLAANLRAALRGEPLQPFRPQRRTLALLNTADGRAVLAYGPVALQARWAWWLKDRLNRGFVERFDRARRRSASPAGTGPAATASLQPPDATTHPGSSPL
jgi:selenide,water dikinase